MPRPRLFLSGLLLLSLAAGLLSGQAGPMPPKILKRPPPIYPYNVQMAGLTGKVEVEFVIDTEGQVSNPVVVRSNNPWFERPALDAILKWKFEPARMNGKAVNTRAAQTLEFQINTTDAFTGMADNVDASRGLWSVPARNKKDRLPPELQWDKAPQPVSTAFPVYPWTDLQANRGGSTTLRFVIGTDGRVVMAKALEATTPEMAQAVLAMIDTWVFTSPEKADGTRCFATLTIRHEFKPSGSGDVPVTHEARRLLRQLAKAPEKIVPFSALDQAPRPLSRRPPVYPTALREAGQPGSAVIEFLIDEQGDAQLPQIVSSTVPEFGFAAAQAVATWRFEVPRQKGKKVATRVRVPMDFVLPDPPAGKDR
jgi:TonB family protein